MPARCEARKPRSGSCEVRGWRAASRLACLFAWRDTTRARLALRFSIEIWLKIFQPAAGSCLTFFSENIFTNIQFFRLRKADFLDFFEKHDHRTSQTLLKNAVTLDLLIRFPKFSIDDIPQNFFATQMRARCEPRKIAIFPLQPGGVKFYSEVFCSSNILWQPFEVNKFFKCVFEIK